MWQIWLKLDSRQKHPSMAMSPKLYQGHVIRNLPCSKPWERKTILISHYQGTKRFEASSDMLVIFNSSDEGLQSESTGTEFSENVLVTDTAASWKEGWTLNKGAAAEQTLLAFLIIA